MTTSKIDLKELRALWEAGMSDRKMAKTLGVDASTVTRARTMAGLGSNGNKYAIHEGELLLMVSEGKSLNEMVAELEATTRFTWDRSNIRKWMTRRGLRLTRAKLQKPKPPPTPLEAAAERSTEFMVAYCRKWIVDPWSLEAWKE